MANSSELYNGQKLLARRGNFVLLKDYSWEDEQPDFVVYESTPEDWKEGFANYGKHFQGIGQAIINLLIRFKRGY